MNKIYDSATGLDPTLQELIANNTYQRAATYTYALLSELNVPLYLVSAQKNQSMQKSPQNVDLLAQFIYLLLSLT